MTRDEFPPPEDSMGSILATIPARGGSRRVPRKNIRTLCGKPAIAHTIEAALESNAFSRIVASTDDYETARIAKQLGAEIPFIRPAELAQDNTPGIAPVLHATRWLDECGNFRPEYVMLLQPTSPLRTPEDIEAAIQLAREKHADADEYGMDSRALLQQLRRAGIQTRPVWQPGHLSPAHKGACAVECSTAELLNRDGLSLPRAVGMRSQEQRVVLDSIAVKRF